MLGEKLIFVLHFLTSPKHEEKVHCLLRVLWVNYCSEDCIVWLIPYLYHSYLSKVSIKERDKTDQGQCVFQAQKHLADS